MIRRLLSALLTLFILASCAIRPPAQTAPSADAEQDVRTPALAGHIGVPATYHVQLTNLLDDFARGATVSLIEVASGETRGTSLADANGKFYISFGRKFAPVRAQSGDRSVAYYLEAVKGVKGPNSAPNQAGADAIRLRTLVWFDFAKSGWVSLSSREPAPISISLSTTAVAFFVNQKVVNAEAVNAEAYIGAVDATLGAPPADYTPIGELTAAIYGNLLAQIASAIATDQDPIQALILTSGGQTVNTSTDFEVNTLTPSSGAVEAAVTIGGKNFDPNLVTVDFTGAQAAVDYAGSSATALKVTVPPGARTGLIKVTMNGKTKYSTPFVVTTGDGHRISFTDSGGVTSLYAVSNTLGSLLRIAPDGSTTTLSTALSAPRAVLVNPEGATAPPFKLYVADAGTGKIVQATDTGSIASAGWLSVTDPSALVVGPDGDLYVAETSAGTIRRARVNWTTGAVTTPSVASYAGFSGPVALAFDYKGNLYVVENAAGRVRRFLPGAGDTGTITPSTLDWVFLADPDGVAIDTAGNAFVTSSSNNVVIRVDRFRNRSAFLTLSAPGAIARDAAGSLYVVDQARSLIRRLSLAGDQKIVAYGLAAPRGVAVDTDGNVFVALQDSGAVLKLGSDGKTTAPLLSGIAAPYGLTFRNGKIYVAHTDTQNVTEVTLAGAARSVIPAGLHSPGGVEVSDDGATYYAGRLNLGDSWWLVVPTGGGPFENSGIDVVSSAGAISQRYPLIHGTNDWNGFGQALVRISASQFAIADRGMRKVLLMSDWSAGANYAQKIQDVTPSFSGSRVFPAEIYDLVYDGTRYLYVACGDKNVYRLDTTNFGAAPGTIGTFSGTPHGMTMLGGTLYVVDRSARVVRRVPAPATSTAPDSWTADLAAAGAGDPLGVTQTGGNLYVSDLGTGKIWKVAPGGPTVTAYVTLNGGASRLHAWSDGRLLVRAGDGVYYNVSTGTPPVASQYTSTIGCTGCSINEFFIDAADNVYWSQPLQHQTHRAMGILNSRELARDGNWLYVAATHGVVGFDLAGADELSINNVGRAMGLAVKAADRELYVLNADGVVYSVAYATRAVTNRGTLPSSTGWGLDFDASRNHLYAAAPGNGLVYRIEPGNGWAITPLKVGLHGPMF
ncbi:MAG: hypothetical protein FJZ01_14680 [Candidatus Sericytochromatia bacterium]|nr:hypothetical protein [Candidatus Tanganyikabacteria bacterium]